MSKDGTKLHAWFLQPKGWSASMREARPVVLFFQENAGNMSFRLPFLRLLTRYLNCSVFALRCGLAAARHTPRCGRPVMRSTVDCCIAFRGCRAAGDIPVCLTPHPFCITLSSNARCAQVSPGVIRFHVNAKAFVGPKRVEKELKGSMWAAATGVTGRARGCRARRGSSRTRRLGWTTCSAGATSTRTW